MDLKKNRADAKTVFQKGAPPKKSEYFTAEIVHEIRNPLAAIKGFLQLIKPHLEEIGKEQYAEIALTELNRTNQLITCFLKGSPLYPHTTENVPLNKIVNDLALFYESEAIIKKIIFYKSMARQDVILHIPVEPLKQILINIINNAIEAIEESDPADRTVTIATEVNSDLAAVKITDTGGGITGENMKNLFTPYCSSKANGTGIGLSICKKIIEEHNGSIVVNSIPGEFTTFTVCFPIKSFLSV